MAKKIPHDFAEHMVDFYTLTLKSYAKSLRKLSEIQSTNKEMYSLLKDFQSDPSKIYNLSTKMSDEEKTVLLDLFMRSSIIQSKATKMFTMTAKEQASFADEIDKTAKYFDSLLKKFFEKQIKK